MRFTNGLIAKLVVLIATVLMFSLISCSGTPNDLSAPSGDSELILGDDFYKMAEGKGTAAPPESPGGGGGAYIPGLHDAHLDIGMGCLDCHTMHSGVIPDREKCLECHVLGVDVKHKVPNKQCYECHKD